MIGVCLLESVEIHLCRRRTPADGLGVCQAGQCSRVIRCASQQLQPVFAGKVIAVLTFPVAGLVGELLAGGIRLDRLG